MRREMSLIKLNAGVKSKVDDKKALERMKKEQKKPIKKMKKN